MPNTYVALRTETVAVATPSVTFDLSSISGYTDLVVIVSARSVFSAAEVAGFVRVGNGSIDTGSNYSSTRLLGTGSSASSARATNVTRIPWDAIPGATSAAGNFCTTIIHINNYSNSTTFKTFLIRSNEPNNYTEATVGLWRSTSAINQVQIYGDGGANLAVGTVISLYGIANADQGAAKATGGMITEDSQYWYHTFGASGTFTPKQALTCDYLVVAGGGGSYNGSNPVNNPSVWSSGGGAGGYRHFTNQSVASSTAYTVTVGAGGSAGDPGTSGSNSSFIGGSISSSATGGGRGAMSNSGGGANGGSGGGGGGSPAGPGGTGNAGSYTPVEGFAGGAGGATFGGGGGGSAGAGTSGTTGNNAAGGAGTSNSISGFAVTYAAGGRGGSLTFGPGTANTGNGGNCSNNTAPPAGGSGVVIVRYAK